MNLPSSPGRRRMLLAAVALLAACDRTPPPGPALPAGTPVLALGDSLTHGTGATPETAYPAVLARLTGWSVVNAGVPGDTSAQALERLPTLLEEYRPALVLVGIGGNDFLRRQDEARTRAHIRRIVETAREAGAQVLLIAVPRPTLTAHVFRSLDDHPLYAELAESLDVPLHPGGWSAVLSEPALRSDEIHANAAGYERFAQGLLETLRRSGLQ